MKIKTVELSGPALNWAVGIARGWVTYPTDSVEQGMWFHTNAAIAPRGYEHNRVLVEDYVPSTDWAQGGPIIEREGIGFYQGNASKWWAGEAGEPWSQDGPTPLIAAMRCYVTSKLGNEIDIPEKIA